MFCEKKNVSCCSKSRKGKPPPPAKKMNNSKPSPYEPEEPRCITTPISLTVPNMCPTKGCTVSRWSAWPLEQWAYDYARRPRINIDGKVLPNNLCAAMCDHRNNPQFVGVVGQPPHSYKLPGGVTTAIQFYRDCAQCVGYG